MKTIVSSAYLLSRGWQLCALFAVAAVGMAASVNAEDKVPEAKELASVAEGPGGSLLYTVKFNGGRMARFAEMWKKEMPKDTVVMTEAAERPNLPSFEIRNARLSEVARSVAFLSEGALTIEVVEADGGVTGNIWRIGRPSGKAATAVKMRAITAPNLFTSEERVNQLLLESESLERRRLSIIEALGKADAATMGTTIHPVKDQNVFVLIGTEDGIAGVESYIKACEQNAGVVLERKRIEALRAEAEAEKAGKNGR